MRKSLLFFAAVSLLLASCQKEQLVEEKLSNGVVTEVSATFEALVPDGATKASVSISENTGTFSWQEDDAAAFVLDSKTAYGKGTYNATSKMFQIQGAANYHHDAVYPYDLVGSSPSSEHVTSVTVPSTREWAANQTNVAMYGTYTSDKYTFKHLGGLVKVTVVNVPTTAKTFVFKTAGKKINGTFTVETDGGEKVINTNSTPAENEDIYTLNLPTTITANSTMDFYVPLPVGEGYKFAFYLKDDSSKDLVKIEGTTAQTVARKSILVMPTITLAAASIEDIYKSATIQEVPAGHSGDFLLAKSESVILKLMSSTDDKDITLKYNGVELPKNLKIVVEGDNYFDAKISGNLPKTHVDFTDGDIKEAAFTTNNSTFSIVYPAKISGTLTVKGGNVLLQGATVNMIEVAKDAVADASSNAPVEINMVKYAEQTPKVTGSVVTEANVKVAPVAGETVTVVKVGTVNVEDTGEGTVKQENDEVSVSTFEDFKNAVDKVVAGQTIKVTAAISDAKGITVPEGKQFTVDFGGFTYTCASDPAGSDGTKNQVFQLLKNSTITFKNGTINVKEEAKSQFRFIIQNYANLTLEDITLNGSNLAISDGRVNYTVSNNFGSVEFKGNTNITAAATKGVAFDVCKSNDTVNYPEPPTVTVNTTGTIEGQVEVTGGNLVVTSGTFSNSGEVLNVSSGKVTVNGGNFTAGNVAVWVEGKGEKTADVTLAGGTFTSQESTVVFRGENDQIKITGGEYTSKDNAVIAGNGSNDRTNGNTVTISGGTFNGKISSPNYIACGIYAPWKDNITVTGGTFNITNGAGVVARAGVVTINGGTFKCTGTGTGWVGDNKNQIPCECLVFDAAANYPAQDANSKIVVKNGTFSDLSGVQYVAEGTYKLANNVTLATPLEITSGKTFTIDLNGKTLNGRTNIKHGNITFQNGTIETTGNVQALNVYGSSESSATNYSVVTIASGVTVNAGVYAVCVFGATAGGTGYGAVANIAGTITTTGDEKNGAVFVSGNLGVGNDSEWAVSNKNAVNIQSTAKITSEKDAALALNGSATVTVANGAKLTGATAIAAKRGKLIVNGGTITGTMDPGKSNPDTYMNGTEMTGSAVSATASYKADGPLSVEITKGTFTSKAYTILNNHDGCEFKISGGDFTTTMATKGITVYARLGSVNISGGEFTNNSNSEATLHVGCPAAVTAQLQPKLTISGENTVVKNNATDAYPYKSGWKALTVNMANEINNYKAVTISGGEFHGQKPYCDDSWTEQDTNGYKKFLAEGYEAKETSSGSNVWEVSEQN